MHGASMAGDSFTPQWPLDYEFATDRLLWLRVAEFSPNSCTKKTTAQKEDSVAAFGMPAADKIRQQLEPTDQAFFT